MTPTNSREVLLAAADLLERGTWTQGCYARDAAGVAVYYNEDSARSFCLLGAMRLVAEGHPHYRSARVVLEDHLGVKADGSGPCLGDWNDAPGRTKAEVVAKLREAAEKAES
jgi:hypothetical protein